MTAREGKDVSETGEPVEGSSARAADTPAARPTDHPAYRCVVLGPAAADGSGALSGVSSSCDPLVSYDPHALVASLVSAARSDSESSSRPAHLWLAEACVLPAFSTRSSDGSLREPQAGVDNADTPVSSAKARRRQQREAESHLARVLLGELAAAQGIQLALADWSPRGQAPHHPALPTGFYVSIAHRHGHVLVGLATAPLGLDLEYRNPRHIHDLDARIAMLPADARERLAEVSHLSETERLDGFYRGWVRYEAHLKIN
ncbi:hypothetical protein QD228_03465 [Cobetia sp. 3AK]|uniref:4'-phosphopantetheinyl transferase family protein n=1 Tax=Cobetia sp. 3AK TaxID=3040020 RepID=UPI00244CD863|nr:hypothetical protein [Cobetia sp. 3AK]MDH2372896.1 hypothetical protein [Cobetia sp. 3AK]